MVGKNINLYICIYLEHFTVFELICIYLEHFTVFCFYVNIITKMSFSFDYKYNIITKNVLVFFIVFPWVVNNDNFQDIFSIVSTLQFHIV